jgi:hypothetical protein
MGLLLATLLTTAVRVDVDLGGLLGAPWYVPAGRDQLEAAWALTHEALRGRRVLEVERLSMALPVVGPWLTGKHGDSPAERLSLLTAGVLQAVGLAVGVERWLREPVSEDEGLVLRFSPIAAGQLGLTVRLSGF